MKKQLGIFLKGFSMGAANVVPGVSGGTIALITGIYERLINALKSFDLAAIRLFFSFRWLQLFFKVDGFFLLFLGLGVLTSFVTLARVLAYQFENHPAMVWSVFFGLVLASIPSVGKAIKRWSWDVILVFLVGTAIAVSMAFLTPASENRDMFYLFLCGIFAMCSMIIPGLSGSFVLLLMGNYPLVIGSINALTSGDFSEALSVMIPVGLGAMVGVLSLSRLLSWLFRVHHDRAVGAVTGFVLGSLVIIWPWKDQVVMMVEKKGSMVEKVVGYENWRLPDFSTSAAWLQIAAVVVGMILIWIVERGAKPVLK